MIGVDTNVLLRLLVEEGSPQNKIAADFFAQRSPADPAYISVIVLTELLWVLKRRYKFPPSELVRVLHGLLDAADFTIERRDAVERAAARFGMPKLDFSDLLIAETNRDDGCTTTVSFDREVSRRIPGMELLK